MWFPISDILYLVPFPLRLWGLFCLRMNTYDYVIYDVVWENDTYLRPCLVCLRIKYGNLLGGENNMSSDLTHSLVHSPPFCFPNLALTFFWSAVIGDRFVLFTQHAAPLGGGVCIAPTAGAPSAPSAGAAVRRSLSQSTLAIPACAAIVNARCDIFAQNRCIPLS